MKTISLSFDPLFQTMGFSVTFTLAQVGLELKTIFQPGKLSLIAYTQKGDSLEFSLVVFIRSVMNENFHCIHPEVQVRPSEI